MKILIDARVLDQTNAGIAIFLRELLPFFKRRFKDISIMHKNPSVCDYYSKLGYNWVRCENSLTDNMFKSIIETQKIIKYGEWDVFFSPIWFPRLICKKRSTKVIVMMHDLIYLEESKSMINYFKSYLVTLWGGFLAEKIMTGSKHSEQEIVKKYPFFKNKIKVHPYPVPLAKMQLQNSDIFKKIKTIKGKYFLYVSAMREYKGYKQTIEAFKTLGTSEYQLIMVGKPDVGVLLEENHSCEDVLFTGYVSDAELNALYRNAFALIFPSRSEGFGLPIIEAQYHGCPVITTENPAIVETAGKGALYIKDQSPKNILEAMERLVKMQSLREDIIKEGFLNIQHFLPQERCKDIIDEIIK